jgi:hypothetical protein
LKNFSEHTKKRTIQKTNGKIQTAKKIESKRHTVHNFQTWIVASAKTDGIRYWQWNKI